MIWVRHLFVGTMAVIMAAIILGVLAIGVLQFMLARGPLDLPQLRDFAERKINAQLEGNQITIGSVQFQAGENGGSSRLSLTDVELRDADGEVQLAVPELRTNISMLDLVQGTLSPTEIEIVGSRLKLVRQLDGSLTLIRLSPYGARAYNGTGLSELDAALQSAELSNLTQIEMLETEVTVFDVRTGREWTVSKSLLSLKRVGDQLELHTSAEFFNESGEVAKIIAMAKHRIGTETADISLQFSNSAPKDLADMVGALDWLRILDTRVSGSLAATISQEGEVRALSGVLDLGQGKVLQTPASLPIGFTNAKVYFDYEKQTDRLVFSQLQIDTTSGALTSEGYVNLDRRADNTVKSMSGQFRFRDIVIDRPDLFDAPVTIDEIALDLRISFAPLTIEVGSLTAFDGESTYRISGKSEASADFWMNSYDIDVDLADRDRVMALWPLKAIPKTRKWVVENISKGRINNFRGGLRSKGGKFSYAFNFDIEDGQTRFMDTMPELRQANGYGYLTQQNLRLDLVSGFVIAANDGKVDLAGSSFFIPDITERPAIGQVSVKAITGVQAALYLLDVEKFRFLTKAGLTPEVASGKARASGTLSVPLVKWAKPKDVTFSMIADVTDLASDTLIKGHSLRADRMLLKASEKGLSLTGPARLDGVPVQAKWTLGFGPKLAEGSRIEAQLGLSDENLRALGIVLPKGSIRGEAPATVLVNVKKDAVPTFKVRSELVGAELRVPALQWRKKTGVPGALTLSGKFGKAPTVDNIELSAPGLNAGGKISFRADGTMQELKLTELAAGTWLNSAATIEISPSGTARVSLNGGTMDLRNFNISAGSSSGAANTGRAPVDIRLDRLIIMAGLSLTDFTARLAPGKALKGTFTGRVNGGTVISGNLFPQKYGTAFEIVSDDAGRVLASADLLEDAYGGKMRVVIVPREGDGFYDGTLKFENTRVRNASAIANLLNAISLIGLLQQLNGEGIHFSSVEGQFLLRPNGVQLKNISAIGPSMGMTLDGWYDSARKTVDFEGVTTPFYIVNGMFERVFGPLFGRRKGEGLFSFTYRMRGPSSDPKVVVNPLSILTPGAFREIFRRKVPIPLDSANMPLASGKAVDPAQAVAITPATKSEKQAKVRRLQQELRDLR